MIANTSWKRMTALVLAVAMVIAHAPSAFAGSLLDSALEAAAEVTAARPAPEREAAAAGPAVREAAETRTGAMQAPAGQSDGDRTRSRSVWALIGAGVGIGLAMMVIDRAVEDTSPSTRRERRDGCKLFCS